MQGRTLRSLLPLFLVICIDGMGLGLLFPILNTIVIDPNAGFLPMSASLHMREMLYGFIISVFMLSWFFGAAILGDLSDSIGRKKSLMICLIGASLGYLLAAVAIPLKSMTLLIIGRIIAGFTAGSQPIAQAAIVDISAESEKARNIGLILLASSLGFVAGPLLGGVLSQPHIVSWFNFATPLYFTALVAGLTAVMLAYTFTETYQQQENVTIKWYNAINIFASAFRHEKVRALSFILLIMIIGWSNFFTFISMYLLHTYHFTTFQNAIYMAILGAGFSTGCGLLVDRCERRFGLVNSTIYGFFITSVGIFVTLTAPSITYKWLCAYVIGAAIATGYSALITLFSNQVGEDEQGWVMGVTGSIMALCFGISSLFTGFVAKYSVTLPLHFAFIGVLLSAFMMWFIVRPSHVKTA